MTNDFDFLGEFDDDVADESPDWLTTAVDDPAFAEVDIAEEQDDLDLLRQQVVLAANDLYEEAEPSRRGASLGGGFFGRLTPGQRLVLALLFLLNVIIVAVGILIVTGTLTF